MASYIRTSDHLTVVFDNGESATVYPNHPQYKRIITALNDKDFDLVRELSMPVAAVQESLARVIRRGLGKAELRDGVVYFNDEPIHNTLTDRIVSMSEEGFDIEPMIKFLENLQRNPSFRAVTELYGFLEQGNLPITEDGHFLAYKRVNEDYRDIFTSKMDNSVGAVVEVPRNTVDEDKDRTCSSGLHFCSRTYLSLYGISPGNRTMIVKINPADVVAIPSDYNNAKGRACRYEVIGELEHQHEEALEGAFRPSPGYVEPEDDFDDYSDGDNDGPYDYEDYDVEDVAVSITTQPRVVKTDSLGTTVDTYESVEEAAECNGLTPSAIRRVLRGDRKSTGGYLWRWESTYSPTTSQLNDLDDVDDVDDEDDSGPFYDLDDVDDEDDSGPF